MKDIGRNTLEELLNSNVPDMEGKDIWIWGTGDTAQLYQEAFARLEKERFFIQGYCDNNSEKWGTVFNGKPVISPQDLKQKENICVLICTSVPETIRAIEKSLKEMKLDGYLLDEVILKYHKAEVLACYDMLEDECSKNVYANVVLARMTGIYVGFKTLKNQYFAFEPFMEDMPSEVFVDCGAYVGDTIEKYIWERDGVFKKIIAFEPDKDNFKAMESRVQRLLNEWNLKEESIELHPYGVSDKSEEGVIKRYEKNNGLGSKLLHDTGEEGEACGTVALDAYIKEPYSFLKADVESYEYKMLLGAQKGIKEYKPLLAICLYHNAVDLYSIPLLIKELVPEYRLAVCHHSKRAAETTLYAWIE